MKTLIYKITKIDENGNSELILRGDNEPEVRKEWETMSAESEVDYQLSCGWEVNGISLGTTLLEWK